MSLKDEKDLQASALIASAVIVLACIYYWAGEIQDVISTLELAYG